MECYVPRAGKTEVGSVNSLHNDPKHSQEDTWDQLIIVCVAAVALSVKWKMIL